jgi:hypothetical protein
MFPPDQANDAGPFDEADGQLQDGHTQDGVEDQRQDGDHEDRSPIAQLIAELPEPDQTDNGPAHARGLPEGTEAAQKGPL